MVNKKLLEEIEEYCELNELNTSDTLNEALRRGFTILKYGIGPNKPQIKEKVVEIIKEVPVEKIVEKIVEVEKNVKIDVDGHKIDFIEHIETLNNQISNYNTQINKLKEELKKCIPLCSNCHRDLHYHENK